MECKHETIYESACTLCGAYVVDIQGSSTSATTPGNCEILSLIHNSSYPDNIKEEAIEESLGIKCPPKDVSKYVFSIFYIVHLKNKIPFDFCNAAAYLHIPEKDIYQLTKIASGLVKSIRVKTCIPIAIISPIHYIHDLCKDTSIDEESVRNIIELSMKKDVLLKDENPKYLAIGAVRLYAEINNISVRLGCDSRTSKRYMDKIKRSLEL